MTLSLKKNYLELFQSSLVEESKNSSLEILKNEARQKLCELDKPNIKHESWKYTSTNWFEKELWSLTKTKASVEASKSPRLVFFDGVFSKEDSHWDHEALSIFSLDEAACKNPLFASQFNTLFENDSVEFFQTLNEAFLSEGVFISVTSCVQKPLEVFYFWTKENHTKAAFSKNFLHLNTQASLTLKETHKTLGEGKEIFSNPCLDILLEENSKLRYKKLFSQCEGHRQISSVRAFLKEKSSFKVFYAGLGGDTFRQDTLVKLKGEEAETTLNGLYLASRKQSKDFCFNIKHEAPRTQSFQYFKGLASDESKGAFQGNIFVTEQAQKTRSKQLNKNLLLGEKAEIFTKPQLQIDTDDVKCSHGATVSQLREDEIFYLQTRGLTKDQAIRFLTRAFFSELLELEKKEDKDIFEDIIKASIEAIVQKEKNL